MCYFSGMKKPGCLLILMLSSVVSAQTDPDGWRVNSIHGPSQVGIVDSVAVDLNADGLTDVVSASNEDGQIRAYLNQQDMRFEQQVLADNATGVFRLAVTDINGDQQADILYTSLDEQAVKALINQQGDFQTLLISDQVVLPVDARSADLNQDGLMDVVSLSFEDDQVLLHHQLTEDDFSTQVILTGVTQPRQILIEDYTGDQLPDLLIASSGDDSVRLLVNQGGMVFVEQLISDTLDGIRSIATCEQDKGPADFVAIASVTGELIRFDNNGEGQFSGTVIATEMPGVTSLNCADTNGDDVLDVISVSAIDSSVSVHQLYSINQSKKVANKRDGYIHASVYVDHWGASPLILTQSFFENRVLLYDSQQLNAETVVWEDFPDGAVGGVSGDLNLDGVRDMVVAGFRNDTLYLYDGRHPVPVILDQNSNGVGQIVLFDLDHNGFQDLLVTEAFGDLVYWYRNQGSMQFTKTLISDAINNPIGLAAGNLDNDEMPDVLVTSSLTDSVWWFEWDGQQFSSNQLSTDSDGAIAVCLADFDGDQQNDFVVVEFSGQRVEMFVNEGQGAFTRKLLSDRHLRPYALSCEDHDGDQDVDIILSVNGDGEVIFMRNDQLNFDITTVGTGFFDTRGIATLVNEFTGQFSVFLASLGDQALIELSGTDPAQLFIQDLISPVPGINTVEVFQPPGISPVMTLLTSSAGDSALRQITYDPVIFRDGVD
jgi:hypothetical protein